MNNVSYINQNTVKTYGPDSKKESLFAEGAFIDAKITDVKDNRLTFITKNHKEFTVLGTLMGVKKGDILRFQAVKSEKGENALKLIENLSADAANLGSKEMPTLDIKELFKQNGLIKEENIFEVKSPAEYTEPMSFEEELAVKRLKAKLSGANANMNLAAMNELLASGVSIQDIDLTMVQNVIKEVQDTSPNPEDFGKAMAIYEKDLSKYQNRTEEELQYAKILYENNLPITDKNMDKIKKAVDLFEGSKELSKGAVLSLLKMEAPVNINDLYEKNFSNAEPKEIAENDWKSIEKEVLKHFEKEGINLTNENLMKAKAFSGNEIPITKENIALYDFYTNLKDIPSSKIAQKACEAIKSNLKPQEAFISPDSLNNQGLKEAYAEISESLDKINNHTLAEAERLNIPLTLFNLRGLALSGTYGNGDISPSEDLKLKLMEIQLKLTSEISYNLYTKGISIDTMPLSKALENIRKAENQVYGQKLLEAEAPANQANIRLLTETINSGNAIHFDRAALSADILNKEIPFTLKGISASLKASRIMEGLEAQSVPNAKYGDGFHKVSEKIPDLLKTLDIQDTEENIRAAEILSRSAVEINEENLLQVKIIDYKLEYIHKKLNPETAAELIGDGHNPLDMHVDDIIEYLDKKEGLKSLSREAIAEKIMAMDEKGLLNENNRKAVIGFYRTLNQIERYGAAAIGISLKSGHSPTLGNLLAASDYYRKTKGQRSLSDIKIDDATGFLEGFKTEETIRQILDNTYQAFNKANIERAETVFKEDSSAGALALNKAVYTEALSKEAYYLSPRDVLNLTAKENYENIPLDTLLNQIEDGDMLINQSTEEVKLAYERAKALLSESPETLSALMRSAVPLTLSNIGLYKHIMKGEKSFSDEIKDIAEEIEIIKDALPEDDFYKEDADIKDLYKNIDNALSEAALSEERPIDRLQKIGLSQRIIRLQGSLSEGDKSYYIPVKINGEIRDLNIRIAQSSFKGENINISADLKTAFGKLDFSIEALRDSLKININGNPEIKNTYDKLISFINEAGFHVDSINDEKASPNRGHKAIMRPDRKNIIELGSKIAKYTGYAENFMKNEVQNEN